MNVAANCSSASHTVVELLHPDCIEGMRALLDNSVSLVVTSPPYNLGIRYNNFDDTAARDEYIAWTVAWCREVKRLMSDGASFFLNVGAAPSNPMFPHEVLLALRGVFVLQNTFHWIKSVTVETRAGDEISVGHFKPISSQRFVTDCHEYVFHLTKNGDVTLDRLAVGVRYADKSNIARWNHTGGRDVRCRGNTWFIPYATIRNRAKQRPHPATFPPELAERCIRIHGDTANLTVLDPFVGIGSAAVAAQRCGVQRFIGFDIDEEYLRVAADRVGATVRRSRTPAAESESVRCSPA